MENSEPLVSIITPSYNSSKFIRDTIDSIKKQTYQNYEHIIVDGGSTDITAGIVSEYPDVIMISEPDRGMYDAINKGIGIAKGEIICYLNSDDIFFPDTLEIVVRTFNNNQAEVVIGYCSFIDEKGKKLYDRKIPYLFRDMVKSLGRFPFAQQSTFWTRSRGQEVGFFDENYKLTGDLDFFIRLLDTPKINLVRKSLSGFRMHDNQLSQQFHAMRKEGLRVFEKHGGVHFTKYPGIKLLITRLFYEFILKLMNLRAIIKSLKR